MPTDESRSVVKRYFEAGDRDDLTAWDELCDPNMVVLPGFAEPIRGLEAVKAFTASFHGAFSDFFLRIENDIAEDDRVAVSWTTGGTHTGDLPGPTGTMPATGRRVEMSGMSMLRVEGGRVAEERTIADILGAMQQLGAA
jgi:ketosteroid isomerase-like protein